MFNQPEQSDFFTPTIHAEVCWWRGRESHCLFCVFASQFVFPSNFLPSVAAGAVVMPGRVVIFCRILRKRYCYWLQFSTHVSADHPSSQHNWTIWKSFLQQFERPPGTVIGIKSPSIELHHRYQPLRWLADTLLKMSGSPFFLVRSRRARLVPAACFISPRSELFTSGNS